MFRLGKYFKAKKIEKKISNTFDQINKNAKTFDEVCLLAHLEDVENMYTELYYNALMSRMYEREALENILNSFKACRKNLNQFRFENRFSTM